MLLSSYSEITLIQNIKDRFNSYALCFYDPKLLTVSYT